MPARLLRTRYPGTCAACGCPLPAGTSAWWDSSDKTLRCQGCEGSPSPPRPEEVTPPVDNGAAGASAQRKYERLHHRREQRVRTAHPRIGGLLLALVDEPQSTQAWAVGAEGERRVGAWLDTLTATGAVVLHDRRMPGSKANIDHLVVAPSGVWVVDSKHYEGRIEYRDVGGWFRRDERLFVGGRDRTRLVHGMVGQVAAVESAVNDTDVPVHGVLCFVGPGWSLLARPFEIDGVLVAWPKAAVKLIGTAGPLTVDMVDEVGRRLRGALPAAA